MSSTPFPRGGVVTEDASVSDKRPRSEVIHHMKSPNLISLIPLF